MPGLLKESGWTALVAFALTITMVGLHLSHVQQDLVLRFRPLEVALAVILVFVGRLALGFAREGYPVVTAALGIALALLLGFAPGAVFPDVAVAIRVLAGLVGGVLLVRAIFVYVQRARSEPRPPGEVMHNLARWTEVNRGLIGWVGLAAALAIPFLFQSRSTVDLATLVLLYIMLGWGLNIVVGLAGLLDLG